MNKDTLINKVAWQFAITCLWPNRRLSDFEMHAAHIKINQFLANAPNRFEGYIEFCYRIIMHRYECIHQKGEVTLLSPYKWFTEDVGFRNTEKYKEGLAQNISRRDKELCEAVLDMAEVGTEEIFLYWEKWFSSKKARPQLWLFYLYNAKFSPKICIV